MQRQFNFIYSELVKAEDDLVGTIAYSLYKREKIKFIEDFRGKNNDSDPTESDLKYFHDISKLHCDNYRVMAHEVLSRYIEETVDGEIERIEAEAADTLTAKILQITPTSFLGGVGQNLVGSIAFAVFLAAILMVLVGARIGYDQVAMEMLRIFNGAKIEQLAPPTPGK